MGAQKGSQEAAPRGSDLESTADLLSRVRGGDAAARERLAARYLPILERWAHGLLPAGTRGHTEAFAASARQ